MEIPEKVSATLDELRRKHRHSVVIKFLRGGYYAYEAYSKWDAQLKRRRSYSLYLGKIEEDGTLVPPRRRSIKTSGMKNIEEYVKAGEEALKERSGKGDERDKAILMALSANARASYSEIGRKAGISAQAAHYRIKELEKRYGITYTIDTHAALKFGFYRFLIMIGFDAGKPDTESIRKELEKEPRVQLVMATKGSFDLLIYALFEDTVKLDEWLYKLRKSDVFAPYPSHWNISYFLIANGFIPLRDEFFEIVKERVWRRTKETPRRKEGEIFYREYAVLRALNRNGIMNFKDIDREYGLRRGSADYTFHELVEKKVIRRVTISMNNLPLRYLAIVIAETRNMRDFIRNGKEFFMYMMKDKDLPTNKFVVEGDLGSPYGIFAIIPVYDEHGLEETEEALRSISNGIKISSTVVTGTILGSICLNKLEPRELPIYDFLKREYNTSDEEIAKELENYKLS